MSTTTTTIANTVANTNTDTNTDSEEPKLIGLMKTHLNSFIATKIDSRLLQSCVQFFLERKEFPQIHDILNIYHAHNYNCSSRESRYNYTDAQLAADCLKQLVTSARMQAVWNDFLIQFICRFGAFPKTKDVEYSFNFYYSEQRFPNPDELISMEILQREVLNRPVDADEADRKQSVETKKANDPLFLANLKSFLDGLTFKFATVSTPTTTTTTTATTTMFVADAECSLCLNEYGDGDQLVRLPCNHIFHYGKFNNTADGDDDDKCAGISAWLKRGVNCPLCKAVCIVVDDK